MNANLEINARNISNHIQEYLKINELEIAKPKDVMEYLISKGDFSHDNKNGNPLRKILRKLDVDEYDRLDLIEGIQVKRKKKKRYWSFMKV